MELFLYESDSSNSDDSSDEDDIFDIILHEMAFTPKRNLGPRLNLQDISEDNCEKMFRFKHLDCLLNLSITASV